MKTLLIVISLSICSVLGAFSQITNDGCSTAISLIANGSCVTYNQSGATPSNEPNAKLLCGWSGNANDIWFSIVVPLSGKLTVEINMVSGGPGGMMMEVLEGSCGNLNVIACSQSRNNYMGWEPFPKIDMEGLTAGSTVYIRATSGNDNESPFQICVKEEGYSDPCKIEKILVGSQSGCDPSTNTYTQNLEVHYRHYGSVDTFEINGQRFGATSSPQTVTVSLPAHGGYQNIHASFIGNWSRCVANSQYDYGDAFMAPTNCYNQSVVNDEPCDAIFLAVGDGCVEYIGNNTGATHSMTSGINYNFECEWAGSPMDVWYQFEVPSSGNVIINTYMVNASMEALFEVYKGSCGSLNYIGGCAGRPDASMRYDGLGAGEMIFLRVAERNGDAQGDFGICIIEPEALTNDVCIDAVSIPLSFACTGKVYSMHTASPSGIPTPVQSCEDQNNNHSRDVWFKITVPNSGIVNVFTEQVERSSGDLLMSVYEGECSSLNELECIHSNRSQGQVAISIYGRDTSEVLYVRVSRWGSWEETRSYSAFRICATSSDAVQSDQYYESECHTYRHNTSLNTGWMSCNEMSNPNPARSSGHWMLFDLDSTSSLETIHIWNLNHPEYLNNGVSSLTIDYLATDNNWLELGVYNIAKANGSGLYEGQVIEIENAQSSSQFLFTLSNNHGGDCTGISEIQLGLVHSGMRIIEDCLEEITLTYPIENVAGNNHITYRTNEKISGNIHVLKDGHLVLDAHKGVNMNPGFEVNIESILEVYMNGCTEENTQNPDLKYIGAGTTDGFKLTVSSNDGMKSIDGSGMNAEYMLASRFLAQSTLGFEKKHVDDVLQMGYEAWIDQQVTAVPSHYLPKTLAAYADLRQIFLDNTPHPTDTELFGISEANTWRDLDAIWWTVHEDNEDLLRQRIAFALSQIFVISTNVDDLADDATGVADFYDMLVDHSFGNFRDLLEEVTLHACMGFYLSHLNNPKTDLINNIFPDENYAREIMQLFSIGIYELNSDGTNKLDNNGRLIQTYNNDHVKELAKVFTGLGGSKYGKRYLDANPGISAQAIPDFGIHNLYNLAGDEPMVMFEDWHEQGTKTIVGNNVIPSGQTGMEDIEMALDFIFNHDNVGPFIGRQLIQKLVTSNPSAEYVKRITNIFNDNGAGVRGDLGAVVKAILLDEEARSCELIKGSFNGKLREPVTKYLHMIRFFGIDPNVNPHIKYYGTDLDFLSKQQPLRAPSVFNFYQPTYKPVGPIADNGLVGPEFQIFDPQTAVGISNLMHESVIWDAIFSEPQMYDGDNNYDNKRVNLDFADLVELKEDEELINFLDQNLTHGRLSDKTRDIIRVAIRPMRDWDPIDRNREKMALYLILNSPDYNILK